ncbi:MAG: DUF2304 family protein, partial [Candidatus Altiarchaeota archaeon]|nr:DUF2304 family protein [Candidatus Altiarchaeota archaeon]
MLIQVLGLVFSLFALSRVILRFREGKIQPTMFLLWVFVWVSTLVFVVSPESFTSISNLIGIQRPLDAAFVVGLVISYYLVFRLYILFEDMRSDLAKLVREIALQEKKK